MTSARLRSRPQSSVAFAPTAAPIAKNAICPSDTCPAHPVSTTTDRPSTAYTPMTDALYVRSTESTCGKTSSKAVTSATPPHFARRTTGIRPTSSGIGRTSSAACHVDDSASSTRVEDDRLSINATMMMTARIGSIRNGLEALKPIEISRMPSATAFTPMASRFVIRPSTRAASAAQENPDRQRTEDGQADDAGSQEDRDERHQRRDATTRASAAA